MEALSWLIARGTVTLRLDILRPRPLAEEGPSVAIVASFHREKGSDIEYLTLDGRGTSIEAAAENLKQVYLHAHAPKNPTSAS